MDIISTHNFQTHPYFCLGFPAALSSGKCCRYAEDSWMREVRDSVFQSAGHPRNPTILSSLFFKSLVCGILKIPRFLSIFTLNLGILTLLPESVWNFWLKQIWEGWVKKWSFLIQELGECRCPRWMTRMKNHHAWMDEWNYCI